MAKEKKKRSDKYDEKLKIDGTFEDVIGESMDYTPKDKEKPKAAKEDQVESGDSLKKQDKPIK